MSFVTNEMKAEIIQQEVAEAEQTYSKAFEENGETHASVRWATKEGQERRFEVLAQIGDLEGAIILDVGCGLGHFREWLTERSIHVSYTGLDITGRLIDQARMRAPQCEFILDSILSHDFQGRKFDYVFASGLFADYPKGGIHWMTQAIASMWSLCNKGLAFNSLSLWTNVREFGELHADPAETINFCHTLTDWVTLRHDYHPRDFTVFMRHEKAD